MRNSNTRFYLALILCIFLFLTIPKHVVGDCTCEPENEERNKPEARKYKIGAIASILIGGTIGVCIPILGKSISALHPEKNVFFIIKAFAAGVILSTGFIHVLPDAFENLTSPCLKEHPWGDFPFTGFIAMVAAIGTLMVDTYATSYYTKANNGSCNNVDGGDVEKKGGQMNHDGDVPIHTHASHGHSHGAISSIQSSDSHKQLLRDRVTSQVLELGIIVHSVIIGISLGASENPKTIRPLVAALTFHQFFEGMGLGGCIAQAKFKVKTVGIMALFFSLTTPIGIGIGMGISSRYDEDSPKALIVEGVLNSASAGILIYMALVDLLAADFMHPKVQTNGRLQLSVNVSLLLGAGCMALLAKWA